MLPRRPSRLASGLPVRKLVIESRLRPACWAVLSLDVIEG